MELPKNCRVENNNIICKIKTKGRKTKENKITDAKGSGIYMDNEISLNKIEKIGVC